MYYDVILSVKVQKNIEVVRRFVFPHYIHHRFVHYIQFQCFSVYKCMKMQYSDHLSMPTPLLSFKYYKVGDQDHI